MAVFEPGVTVRTEKPFVVVDAGLKPGTHEFELVVVNERGVESAPTRVKVEIVSR